MGVDASITRVIREFLHTAGRPVLSVSLCHCQNLLPRF